MLPYKVISFLLTLAQINLDAVEKAKTQPNTVLPEIKPSDPNAPPKKTNNQKKRDAKKYKKKLEKQQKENQAEMPNTQPNTPQLSQPKEPASQWPHNTWVQPDGRMKKAWAGQTDAFTQRMTDKGSVCSYFQHFDTLQF